LGELGEGGMAKVYRAHDPSFDREVALKVLPREFLHHKTFQKRFELEAKTIASLEHEHIVPVYDFGQEDGQPFIVMRYMRGGSLADRLDKGPLTPAETSTMLVELADALDLAHRAGVVHRDLKPANILFDAVGKPFLSDFGIVKIAEETSTFTGSGVVGTPAYMSPEQVEGEGRLDGRSDIYALGVIAFEMLSGKRPYTADTPMRLAMKHVLEPVPDVRTFRKNLPASVAQVLQKTLQKSPKDRYASAREFANALKQAVDTPAAPPTKVLDEEGGAEPVAKKRRGRGWRVVAGFLAAAAVCVTSAVLLLPLLPGRDATPTASVALQGPTASQSLGSGGATQRPVIETDSDESSAAADKTPTPQPEVYFPLSDCAASRTHSGDLVYIAPGGGRNAIRSEPNTRPTDNVIGHAEENEAMIVVGGPECNFGWLLWEVITENGVQGWTPESDGNELWFEPHSTYRACPSGIESALSAGERAYVSPYPDTANIVRSAPGSSAQEVGRINPGQTVEILDGPECSSGLTWWLVALPNGTEGWTAEGRGNERWLLPER
jgi:serine/threonine-protein kinase